LRRRGRPRRQYCDVTDYSARPGGGELPNQSSFCLTTPICGEAKVPFHHLIAADVPSFARRGHRSSSPAHMEAPTIAENCRRVLDRIQSAAIRSHRDPSVVKLLAVTKTVSAEAIRIAASVGIREVGENRLQEALAKKTALADLHLRWHFIGHLQTNKAKKVIESFDVIQSVDRADLAEKLNQHASAPLPIFIEVNLGNEETKSGVPETNLARLMEYLQHCQQLSVLGLMAIPPYFDDAEKSRPFFVRLRGLAQKYKLNELSMGMSHDFEIAIEEGATMVRVGTALFGARN
jgi:pyridoxal phosphate enzyme (YggS family)